MAWFTSGNWRTILTTETDDGSPLSDELMSQIRENFEGLQMWGCDTAITGSATSDPASAAVTGTDNSGDANSATEMVDTTSNFLTLGVIVGDIIQNTTDGSSGTITSLSTTTNPNDTLNFSGGLSGGTDNDFDNGDAYSVDVRGTLVDTAQAFDTDIHNGKLLVMTSGLAIGNIYTIDDTEATKLACRGDTLYSDGVRSGDTYKIFYNFKDTGHTHDGTDAAYVTQNLGRTFVDRADSVSAIYTDTAWGTEYTSYFVIPTNPTNLIFYFLFQVIGGDNTENGHVRFKVTDNDSTVHTSSEVTEQADYGPTERTISLDLSSAASGYAKIEIEMYMDTDLGIGDLTNVLYGRFYWNT